MIVLNKDDWGGKDRYYQCKTWEKVHKKSLKLLLKNFQNNYLLWENLDKKFLTSFKNMETFQKYQIISRHKETLDEGYFEGD